MGALTGLKKFIKGEPMDEDIASLPRWFRGERLADVERDIELAEASRGAYKRLLRSAGSGPVRLYSSDDRARSLRAKLREDLDEAFTEDEKMEVVEHYIQKLMHGGRRRHVAESMVMRMLEELQEEA